MEEEEGLSQCHLVKNQNKHFFLKKSKVLNYLPDRFIFFNDWDWFVHLLNWSSIVVWLENRRVVRIPLFAITYIFI